MGDLATYTFTTPTNYTYDTDKVEITGGKAQLKLTDNAGETFTEDYADDTDFTYDSDKAEFDSGQVQQKSQSQANATFGATYTTDIDGSWGDGTLKGTAAGGASVSGGKLDLRGGGVKNVVYDAVGNSNFVQTGTIRWRYTPNYSGTPAANRYLFAIGMAAGNNNLLYMYHSNTARLYFICYNSSGAAILNTFFDTWTTGVAGTEYEFELNMDFTTGDVRLFIDGVQKSTTKSAIGTRSNTATKMVIGSSINGAATSDCYMNDVVVFNTVQHTANYTPGYTLADDLYAETKVDLPQFSYSGVEAIQALTAFAETGTGTPRYILNGEYWNGAAWAASDDSYAQASSAADVNTNIGSLTVADDIDVSVVFPDGGTQNAVSNNVLTYTGKIYPDDDPTVTFNSTIRMEGLEGFDETASKTGSDEIKYILRKESTDYYWDGAAWSSSNGTYAQSNTAAEIETNKASFASLGTTVTVIAFLHSNDGSTTPELDQVTVEYDFSGEASDDISICTVYGYQTDSEGNPSTAAVTATLTKDGVKYKDNILIRKTLITVTPNSEGYFELDLIETENMEGDVKYEITTGHRIYVKEIPNEASKAIWEL